jgi:hypothetical protein
MLALERAGGRQTGKHVMTPTPHAILALALIKFISNYAKLNPLRVNYNI